MLKIKDLAKYSYPYKLLLEGLADSHSKLYSVIESFKDKNLTYKNSAVKNRNIGEMVSHIVCAQVCFYTQKLVQGEDIKCECFVPKTIKEALEMIQENLDRISRIWTEIDEKEFEKEVRTEWGQVMTKEVALLQSIEHTMYHVGEICFLAGMGGFYKGVLG